MSRGRKIVAIGVEAFVGTALLQVETARHVVDQDEYGAVGEGLTMGLGQRHDSVRGGKGGRTPGR